MRRWLAILLMLLLPVQLSWAAVAGYCRHEPAPTVQHLGHHEHQHRHADKAQAGADGVDKKSGDLGALDDDCATCHLSCAQPLPSGEPMMRVENAERTAAPVAQLEHESHIPDVPAPPDRALAA